MKRVQGTRSGDRRSAASYSRVELLERKKRVREKDINLSAEKESLKGSRKVRLLKRARKKDGKNDIQVSNKKNLHKVLEV